MLPKINRIKRKRDFEDIFKRGANHKNSLIVLKIADNGLDYSRFGIIISQKVSKKAVIRNVVRRRISAVLKQKSSEFKTGKDVVFIGLSGIEKKDFEKIKEAVNELLLKAKITNV